MMLHDWERERTDRVMIGEVPAFAVPGPELPARSTLMTPNSWLGGNGNLRRLVLPAAGGAARHPNGRGGAVDRVRNSHRGDAVIAANALVFSAAAWTLARGYFVGPAVAQGD